MNAKRIRVGCSGWYYWHWKGTVYPAELPSSRWFEQYRDVFNTVELNAPFYHWPKLETVRKWARAAPSGFEYTVKVNRLITHEKRLKGTKTLVREFSKIADILGDRMGCFLFQLPPSFHYTPARLRVLVDQLESGQRNVVELRHRSWWNEEVFGTFRQAGLIFCTVSAPRLPDHLIETAETVYLRLHGAKQWYRYDYSEEELKVWARTIRESGASEVWAYFNNDFQGCAFRNAQSLKRLLC